MNFSMRFNLNPKIPKNFLVQTLCQAELVQLPNEIGVLFSYKPIISIKIKLQTAPS